MSNVIEKNYESARETYREYGVDADEALRTMRDVFLSLPCWQGDDVGGFETPDAALTGGGIAATGNYPGKARTPDELRADMEAALALIPGRHRVNLHSIYGEFGGARVPRDEFRAEHFRGWVDWAHDRRLGLDFNCTCFSHPKAATGYTLSDFDPNVRRFWIEHIKRCREIGAQMGAELGTSCLHNLWIPDGSKDATAFRLAHRELLRESLDEIFSVPFPPEHLRDSVESKLFGLGAESYTVGSHEFYMGYATAKRLALCLDMGHFHPTESVADKISALLLFLDELVIHVSRGVRWDSDHAPILDDALLDLAAEIVRARALTRVRFALDFFDASINRVGAWAIGARATLQAILAALLEPTEMIRERERAGDGFARLALLEEVKTLPLGAVWDHFCETENVPPRGRWIDAVQDYETRVLSRR